ncbi:helix-turn-helix domain-containing protein [Puia sp. P3]|uniref:helix-turn-helix domain-containing protein n=1 Tax=Puia sp. P3 TaxID=3423952 RepID=UPI003D665764
MSPVLFFNQLHRRDARFNAIITDLISSHKEKTYNRLRFEEQMTALLTYHLQQHDQIAEIVNNLPPVRKSTRVELYKRLSRSMDVLRSGFCGEISLDQLAAEACLSKYHFLRLFRGAYGLSPYQYIQHLRIEKAISLLRDSKVSINDLADRAGIRQQPVLQPPLLSEDRPLPHPVPPAVKIAILVIRCGPRSSELWVLIQLSMVSAKEWFDSGIRLPYDAARKRIANAPDALSVFNKFLSRPGHNPGTTISFLPGFPTGSYDWSKIDALIEKENSQNRLYIEYIGQGESDKPEHYSYSTFERADLVEALWKYHQIDTTFVVTFDYSSLVAMELLRRQQEKIEKA